MCVLRSKYRAPWVYAPRSRPRTWRTMIGGEVAQPFSSSSYRVNPLLVISDLGTTKFSRQSLWCVSPARANDTMHGRSLGTCSNQCRSLVSLRLPIHCPVVYALRVVLARHRLHPPPSMLRPSGTTRALTRFLFSSTSPSHVQGWHRNESLAFASPVHSPCRHPSILAGDQPTHDSERDTLWSREHGRKREHGRTDCTYRRLEGHARWQCDRSCGPFLLRKW